MLPLAVNALAVHCASPLSIVSSSLLYTLSTILHALLAFRGRTVDQAETLRSSQGSDFGLTVSG